MARTEINVPVSTIPVAGHTHEVVQGIPVAAARHPFKDGHLEVFSVVGNGKVDESEYPQLRIITPLHGRSYAREFSVIWNTEKGVIFTGLNSKGNNLSSPEIFAHGAAVARFAVNGLQDSDSLTRAITASHFLLSRGIPTEMYLKYVEPLQLPFQGEVVSREMFKLKLKQLLKNDHDNNHTVSPRTKNDLPSREQMPDVEQALDSMTFFITERATQVNERLSDLQSADLKGIGELLVPAFRYINLVEQQKAKKNPGYNARQFDVHNLTDLTDYALEYLPKAVAENIAAFHRHGLIHYYPHSGNISTVGTFYDLDSVRGEPLGLGDKPITFEDIKRDIKMIVNHGSSFHAPAKIAARLTLDEDNVKVFDSAFLEEYIHQMGWEGDIRYFGAIMQFEEEFTGMMPPIATYYDAIQSRYNFTQEVLTDEDKVGIVHLALRLRGRSPEEIARHYRKEIESIRGENLIGEMTEEMLQPDGLLTQREIVESAANFIVQQGNREVLGLLGVLNEALKEIAEEGENKIVTPTETAYIVFQRLFQKLGWEEDILKHIPVINDTFYSWMGMDTDFIFNEYYADLAQKALGKKVDIPGTRSELTERFHEADQQIAEESLVRIFEETKGKKNQKKRIDDAMSRANWEYTRFHSDRRTHFMMDYVEQEIRRQLSEELVMVEEKYGKEAADGLVYIIERKYEFILDISDEESEQIELESQERLEGLVSNLSIQYGFAPHAFSGKIDVSRSDKTTKENNMVEIKAAGWEEEIVKHLKDIREKFSGFHMISDDRYLEYYVALLGQQVGIEYAFTDEDKNQVIEAFLKKYEEDLENLFKDALEKAGEEAYEPEVISQAYEDAGYDATATELDVDSWVTFLLEYLPSVVERKYRESIEQYLSQFSEEERDMYRGDIYYFLTKIMEKDIESDMTPERQLEIVQKENLIDHNLLEKYIMGPLIDINSYLGNI